MALLRLFGHPAIDRDGETANLSVPAKAVALLGMLAVNHDRALSREPLSQMLWPDADPQDARANLRRHLHLLSKALGEGALIVSRRSVQWNPACDIRVDAIEFDRVIDADPAGAVAHYAGTFCEGIWDEALTLLQEEYRSRYEAALRRLAQSAQNAGDRVTALLAAQRLSALNPYDEGAAREMISLRLQSGDRAGALRDYHALASRLRNELDTVPEAATQALFERLMAQSGGTRTPTNLTGAAASLVGRQLETQEIAEAIRPNRLVSIVGAGGIGKTRLGVHVATLLFERFPDGVWFVDLTRASCLGDAVELLASALDVALRAENSLDAVCRAVTRRQQLIVLDNCEHLVDDAALIVRALLDSTQSALLVTSRKRLGVAEEIVHALHTLPTPAAGSRSADEISQSPAVRLFLERATAVAPAFRLTHENSHAVSGIVRRLDGLPLAIELVAARANLLTIEGIAKRIAERPDDFRAKHKDARHQTLRGAIDWSYALLSPKEQRLFALLGIFPASWDLDACEAVCSAEDADVFSTLSELVEASIVVTRDAHESKRYDFLETLRAYASQKLDACGDREIAASRHIAYYRDLAERLEEMRTVKSTQAYVSAIRIDYPNFMQALRYAQERGAVEDAARIAVALARYWDRAGSADGDTIVARLLENLVALRPETVARLYRSAGYLANARGAWGNARDWNDEAARRFAALGMAYESLEAETAAAYADSYGGAPLTESIARYESFVNRMRECGPEWAAAKLLIDLGAMYGAANDHAKAQALLLEALTVLRRHNRMFEAGAALIVLSRSYRRQGFRAEAIATIREAVDIFEQTGDPTYAAEACRNYARLQAETDPFAALDTLDRALAYLERAYEPRFILYTINAASEALGRAGLWSETAQSVGFYWAFAERSGYKLDDLRLDDFLEETLRRRADELQASYDLGRTFGLADLRRVLADAHRSSAAAG